MAQEQNHKHRNWYGKYGRDKETQSSACGVVYGRNCLTMGVPHLFGVWCPNLSTFPYSSSFLWKNATKMLIDSSLTFMPAACLSFAEENS